MQAAIDHLPEGLSHRRNIGPEAQPSAPRCRETAAGRILVVEDDPCQARLVRATLETAGHRVTVCDDPRRFAAELAGCRPDLVLMDVMLPGASGYELVRSLRQEPESVGLPVRFLTAKGQMQTWLESAWTGGDDHLVKPVAPAALLAKVAERLERSRHAESLIARDPVTQALTEEELQRRADAAVAEHHHDPRRRAVWAVIELDHLWSIHECYGEATANGVLAATASMLRRQLRQGDSLGSCGVSRLALLLDGLRPRQAYNLVEEVRRSFSTRGHRSPGRTLFRTTFSAGIAALEPGMSAGVWREAAERALRVARAAGRNRVELAADRAKRRGSGVKAAAAGPAGLSRLRGHA
jgi:diguanylate cyclase (GGDEF)-like protein